jgi:hypothetical protein
MAKSNYPTKSTTLIFRVTPEAKEKFRSSAKKRGLSLTEALEAVVSLNGVVERAEEIGNEIGLDVKDVLHLALDMYTN